METRTLLGHLAQWGAFFMQGEVLCTQGLCYFLQEYDDARSALAADIAVRSGVELGDGLTWRSEAFDPCFKDRPDLEATAAEGQPVVEIEAKLGAPFGPGQLESYAKRFVAERPSVLMVLVPRSRIREAEEIVADTFSVAGSSPWQPRQHPSVRIIVVSWDEVLATLKQSCSPRLLGELEQFDAMYRVLSGYDIKPLAGPEELAHWREREADFVNLVDRITKRLTTHHKLYPIGLEEPAKSADGLEARGYRRRYVCRPLGDLRPCFSIGTRDPFKGYNTPVWMRFHAKTPCFPIIETRLRSSPLATELIPSGGHLWIPLEVPSEVSGERMIDVLMAKAEAVIRVAYGASAESPSSS